MKARWLEPEATLDNGGMEARWFELTAL